MLIQFTIKFKFKKSTIHFPLSVKQLSYQDPYHPSVQLNICNLVGSIKIHLIKDRLST